MQPEEEVYADWGALRLVVPAVAVFLILTFCAFFAYQELRSDPSNEQGGTTSTTQPSTTLAVDLTPEEQAQRALDEFVEVLDSGDIGGLTYAFATGPEAQVGLEETTNGLGPYQLDAAAEPIVIEDDFKASANVTLTWTVQDERFIRDSGGTGDVENGAEADDSEPLTFMTTGRIPVIKIGTNWLVDWEPGILEETLAPGDVLIKEQGNAPRAPILGRDSFELVSERAATTVGVTKRPVADLNEFSQQVGPLIGRDPAGILAEIGSLQSDIFIPLAVLTEPELQAVKPQLDAIVGVGYEETTALTTPSPDFARAWLGRHGPVTKEILDHYPELYVEGDTVGLSGLQRAFNERLTGQAGFQIIAVRRFALTDVPEGEDPDLIFSSAVASGEPVTLSIDGRVQSAAEQALTATPLPSALVAVEVSSGQVLAMANGPSGSTDNFAATGQYPPGSIFKTVTAAAALSNGYNLQTPVDCPASLVVDGRQFVNAEGEVLGTVPMLNNFALSCNTAFISIGASLDSADFAATARSLGIGTEYAIGFSNFTGQVPVPSTPVDKAATSFGQGQVLVSPLSMAVMAATVANGAYNQPTLVLDPAAQDPAAPVPLDATVADSLRQMMRAVVTQGTGGAVAGSAGGPVSGKTGTAEFGNDVPPKAHAWFVGFQGDVAFAVFVEGGEFGGATAAPIANNFLNILAQSG